MFDNFEYQIQFDLESTEGFEARQKIWKEIYADDVKLYTELRCDAVNSLFQVCLDHICQWSLTWQLHLSSQKCCVTDVG